MKRWVAYYRVSTTKQGSDGLGIEAQKAAVARWLGGVAPVAEFVEVESGSKNNRPALEQALQACELHQASLVVARLDRLTRNVYFLQKLKQSQVPFICCDMPNATELTLDILVSVAAEELRRTSANTRNALAAAKARGVKLGNPQNLKSTEQGRIKGREVIQKRVWGRLDRLKRQFGVFHAQGVSLRHTATILNDLQIPAARGGRWSAAQVLRVAIKLGFHPWRGAKVNKGGQVLPTNNKQRE